MIIYFAFMAIGLICFSVAIAIVILIVRAILRLFK